MDANFVDVGVSFFDEEFTLDPYPFIEALYGRDDVLGFAADGMKFLFRFDDLDGLLTSYERLRGVGIVPKYAVNHGFQVSIYYRDPDDNEVELGCDVFDGRDAMNAWFAKGHFRDNFFGHVFDPDEVLKWHREGVPASEIFERTYPVEAVEARDR